MKCDCENRQCAVLGFVVFALVVIVGAKEVRAQDVVVMQPQTVQLSQNQFIGINGTTPCQPATCAQLISTWGVKVYSGAAADAKFSAKSDVSTAINSEVAVAQTQIEAALKNEIDQLPQNLFTQSVRDDIQARVLANVQPQLDGLKQQIAALQQQIAAIQAIPPPNAAPHAIDAKKKAAPQNP